MSQLTYGRMSNLEVAEGLLNLFVYAEQHSCEWDKLEEKIAEVKYEKLNDEDLDWFVQFLFCCCIRVWGSDAEEVPLNMVVEHDRVFHIKNYDWNAFRFAIQKNCDSTFNSKLLVVSKDVLSKAEIKWLRSRCKCSIEL